LEVEVEVEEERVEEDEEDDDESFERKKREREHKMMMKRHSSTKEIAKKHTQKVWINGKIRISYIVLIGTTCLERFEKTDQVVSVQWEKGSREANLHLMLEYLI